jgi:hypothetical protein
MDPFDPATLPKSRVEPSQEMRDLAKKYRQFYCALRDEGMSESNAVMMTCITFIPPKEEKEDDR